MQTLLQDLRYGARMLMKQPGFTLIAVLTLALGIGANTAIFSLLDQVMLRRLPVERPDELVVLRSPGPVNGHLSSDGDGAASFSYLMYKGLRERNAVFANVLARYAIPLSVSAQGQTERANGELVSGNYFETLGVQPALGRMLTLADDQQAGAHPLAVLSYGYWQRRFGGNASVLNQTLLVNGQALTVTGVARAGFAGVQVGQVPDIFIPVTMKAQMTPNWDGLADWNDHWLAVIGRLKPGFAPAQAEAAVLPAFQALLEEELATLKNWDAENVKRFRAKRLELKPGARGRPVLENDAGEPLLALFGMVALVLLIACTNVANLLLVRGLGRQRELAIRLALGASRGRLVGQLLIESLLLALLGGALGLLLAAWISELLVRALDTGAGILGLTAQVDGRLLAFTALVSLVTGVFFGLIPAWRVTRGELTTALKDQSAAASLGRAQSRLRQSLVIGQVALTMLLLIGAGLFTRTLWNLGRANLGLRAEHLTTFSIAPELNGYSPERTAALGEQLQDALATAPGVQAVAAGDISILTGDSHGSNVTIEGAEKTANDDDEVNRNRVTPGYFSTLGIPLVAGREFTRNDTATSPKVAIINEAMAKRFFPNRNPLGARFIFGGGNVKPDIEIVGVVKNSSYAHVREAVPPIAWQPCAQYKKLGRYTFYLRSASDAAAIIPVVRQAVQRLDANLPVYAVKTMESVVNENLFAERLLVLLSLSFGALAALLAGIGLYGVLAWTVVQRTRELGIRVALGATPRAIRWLVLAQGLWLTLAGIGFGVGGGFALARLLKSLLFNVNPADLATFVGAALLLAAVAVLACWLPARRAAKVDPMVALRCE